MGKLKSFYQKLRHSLKTKLFLGVFIIFLILVIGFELFTFYMLRNYHYDNLKNLMQSQAGYSSELYITYVGDYTLSDNILNERLQFLTNSEGQIQILDMEGRVIYDNIASEEVGHQLNTDDVSSVLLGEASTSINKTSPRKDSTLSVSVPLNDRSTQIGAIRVTASLKNVDRQILRQFTLFISFGLIAIITAIFMSYYLSRRIFKPINQLTDIAKKYSDGQYQLKSNLDYRSEVGKLAKTMDELSENIIEKDALKTEFISSVSHELRTPLTSIKGWSITLQDDGIDQEMIKEGLRIIEQESDRLSDMVEDLLDFSRFTSPNFRLTKSTFNIVDIAQSIRLQLRPRLKDKDLTVLLNYDYKEIEVVADENRIKQVFINILDNAIKFTPREGTIAINIVDQDEDVMCEIIDTGIGISEKDIANVTSKFYKGTSAGSHTGLGLSICEEIVKAHQGVLEIYSVEGEGTTVRFTIPKQVINNE